MRASLKVWESVKPHVDKIRVALAAAAHAAPWPWLKVAISALDKGLGALTAFENSPIAKKVDSAIKWAINLAKRWQDLPPEATAAEAKRVTA